MDDLSLDELRARLREAEETLDAIRHGEVDAIVMGTDGNRQVYTLDSADRPYRILVEQMQEGAIMLSGDGIVLYANQRAGEILNLPAGQLVGRGLVSFLPATEQSSISRMLAECMGAPARAEFNLPLPDRTIPVVFSFKGLESESGQDRVIYAVISDLTQQRQFEARLNQAQKMEAIGQLTGGLAHDFNNLLQAVHGNLELISRMPADGQRVVRWAESGLRAVDRGAKLTAQLLAFSRSQQLTLGPVAVSGLLEGMADLFTRTLGTSVQVKLALCPEPTVILADATQVELAVLNLAINARDAMPEGGTLVISTAIREIKGEIDVSDGAFVELSVSDDGIGMSPEVIARAFEPFFTTKQLGSGTGLGLAQVYGICQQAGGHVRIASTIGHGTTVSMFFRHAIDQDGVAEESVIADSLIPAHRSPKILVIDDDHEVRSFIVETLETLGYRVDSADNGLLGLELMRDAVPDLVILDFAMPHLDGASVARRAREFGLTVPFIFVSGYADTSALSEAAGSDVALLRKPFTISSLSDIVASTLAVQKSKT